VQSLPTVLTERVVVLDGGLATELERRGHDLSSSLWSAQLLADDPAAIRDVHRAFFAAGAEVATTASYQASVDGLSARGFDAAAMLHRSVALARQARDEHGAGWIAASIGPYGATLADGSEYRGRYGMTVSQLRTFHRPRMEILAGAVPDVLAVETIPCLAEVEALLAELDRIALPAWLSITASGSRTRAGEPIADAFTMARDCPSVVAIGVNCLVPEDVPSAVGLAVQHGARPAVAYPNSGERWDATERDWAGAPAFAPDDVISWITAGARLVGGCCRVGPSEIRALAAQISRLHTTSEATGSTGDSR
jgi:homocysteine S-methyltransferase